jgi:hypothetical protein
MPLDCRTQRDQAAEWKCWQGFREAMLRQPVVGRSDCCRTWLARCLLQLDMVGGGSTGEFLTYQIIATGGCSSS